MNLRSRLNLLIPIAAATLAVALAAFFIYYLISEQRRDEARAIEAYFDQARAFERRIVEGFPIYQDWATPAKEQKLRTHLLGDHLAVVNSMNLHPIEDRIELDARIKAGSLKSLEQNRETSYFFYNVKKEHRALLPVAADGLDLLAERLNKRTGMPEVTIKLAISSVLRTVEYQDGLRDRNANASFVSSHSYGISFDVFYDSFFISLSPLPDSGDGDVNRALETMRLRTGYWLGEALRRQLHAMLAETLIELQNEGKLYAILEKNQRCYHVTIRPQ